MLVFHQEKFEALEQIGGISLFITSLRILCLNSRINFIPTHRDVAYLTTKIKMGMFTDCDGMVREKHYVLDRMI